MSAANQRLLGGLLVLLGLILVVTAIAVKGDGGSASDPDQPAADREATDAPTVEASDTEQPSDGSVTHEPTEPDPQASETATAVTADRTELAAAFLDDFVEWLRTADGDSLYGTLHEASIARYGQAQCQEYTSGLAAAPDFDIEPTDFEELTTWDYETDGRSEALTDIVRVSAIRSLGGDSVEDTFHLAVRDGQVAWLTDCGEPVG